MPFVDEAFLQSTAAKISSPAAGLGRTIFPAFLFGAIHFGSLDHQVAAAAAAAAATAAAAVAAMVALVAMVAMVVVVAVPRCCCCHGGVVRGRRASVSWRRSSSALTLPGCVSILLILVRASGARTVDITSVASMLLVRASGARTMDIM